MTDHADLTARLRGWADAWDDLHGDRLATASTIRADGQAHALRSADVRLLLDALDAADAENARLWAERQAVIDCLNLYGDEIIHDALDAIGFAPLAVSEEATDAEGGSL